MQRYADFFQIKQLLNAKHSVFAYFETIFANFESRDVTLWRLYSISCIQAVTLCPMRCLKARLKVL